MPQTIDDLQIEINSKASDANEAIDALAKSLGGLMRSLGKVSSESATKGLGNISSAINKEVNDIKKSFGVVGRDVGKEMKEALQSAYGSMVSGNMREADKQFSVYENLIKENAKFKNQIMDTNAAVKDFVKGMDIRLPKSLKSEFGDTKAIEDFRRVLGGRWVDTGATDISSLIREMKQTLGTNFDTSGAWQDQWKNLAEYVRRSKEEFLSFNEAKNKGIVSQKDLDESVQHTVNTLIKFAEVARQSNELPQEMASFESIYENIANGIDEIASAIGSINPENLANLATVLERLGSVPNVSKGIREISESLNVVPQETEQVSSSIENIDKAVNETVNSINHFSEEAQSGSDNLAEAIEHDVEEIVEQNNALDDVIQKLNEYKNTIRSMENGSIPFDEGKYREAFIGLNEQQRVFDEFKSSNVVSEGLTIAKIATGFDAAASAVRGFGETASRVSAKLKKVFHGMYAPMRYVIDEYKEKFSSAIEFAKSFGDKFQSVMGKLPEFMNKVFQRFTFTLLRKAINYVIQDLNTAVESLRNFTGTVGQEFNASLTSIQNNLHALGGSIVAAFAPLINAVAPIIDFIVSKLIAAINVINQFFAALTGHSTYAVVKKSKALGGYAGAANKAAKAQEKLNNTVLAFDQLNKLNGLDDKDNGGGGGGGGAGGGGLEWEELPVDDRIKAWADKLKEILAQLFEPLKKAWDRAGEYVISGFKYMVRELGKLAAEIGKDFLTMWNEEETVEMLTNILLIVGDLERVVGNLAKRFRIAWKQNKVGLKILEKIRDIFAILIRHIRNVTEYMVEWSRSINFYPLLDGFSKLLDGIKKVADFLGGVFEDVMKSVVLKYIKWMIEEGLPHLYKKIKEVIDAFDFTKIRNDFKPLWTSLEGFLENFHTGVANAIGNVGKAVAEFANSESFTTFIANIAHFLDRIDAELVEKVFTALGLAIVHLAEALVNFINSDLFQGFIDWLFDTLDGMTAEQMAKWIEGIAKAILVFDFVKFLAPGVAAFIGFLAKLVTFSRLGSIAKNMESLANGIKNVSNAASSNNKNSLSEWSNALNDVGNAGKKTASKMSTFLTSASGFAVVLSGVIIGTVGLVRAFQALVDKLSGGNGILTEIGVGLESYASSLQKAGLLTSNQAHNIFLAIEEYESGNKSLEETTELLISMLKDTGVSAEEADRILQGMYSSGQISESVFNSLRGSLFELGEGFSVVKDSTIDAKVSFDELSEGMLNYANQAHLSLDQISQLEQSMYNQDGSAKTAEDAYNSLIETIERLGLSPDMFINALNEKIPGAINTSESALDGLKGSVDDTMQSVGDSVSSYNELFDSLIKLRDQGDITSSQFEELKETLVKQHDSGVSASDAYDTVLEHIKNMSSGSTEAVGEMGETLTSKFDGILSDITGFGEEVPNSFGKGIDENLTAADGSIVKFGTHTKEQMHDSDWRFGSPSQTAIDFGRDVVLGFNQGISDNADTSLPVIDQWLTSIVEHFTSFAETINMSLVQINESMTAFRTGFTTSLEQVGISLETANVTINAFSLSVNESFTQIGEGVTARLTTLTNQIKNNFNQMKQHIQTSVTATSNLVKLGYENIKNSVTTITTNIQTLLKQKWENIKNNTKTKVTEMKEALSNAFEAMKKKVENVMDKIVEKVGTKLDDMKKKFDNLDLKTVGENVIQGFWDGMKSKFTDMLAWAETAAGQIAATFEKALQMGSPSKLFRKFGVFTVQGYLNGVQEMMPKSTKLISSWGESVTEAYNTSLNTTSVSPSVDVTSDFAGEIINGVYEAVASAMQNYNPEFTVYSELKTDDETLARSVTRGQKNLNRRYSPVLR